MVAFVLTITACEREKQIDLPDATIVIENYDGSTIVQEPNGKIELLVTAQSPAGIKKVEVLVGTEVVNAIEPENIFTYNYDFQYVIPQTANLGDKISIIFRIEDKEGRVVSLSLIHI